MNTELAQVAERCLLGTETDSLSFPDCVGELVRAGFESYTIDFRCATATYYLPNGDSIILPMTRHHIPIAATLNLAIVQAAIRQAQEKASDYTYSGFCEKIMAGGCCGYVVSFSGRRALYLGRTAETHIESFPPL